MYLRDLGFDAKNSREGIVHKYWKEKIADEYRKKGFKVSVEKYINGRPDIIAEKDGRRIAIEIETGKSDYLANIERNLKADFDEIIVMATSRKVEGKIKEELKRVGAEDMRIKIRSIYHG